MLIASHCKANITDDQFLALSGDVSAAVHAKVEELNEMTRLEVASEAAGRIEWTGRGPGAQAYGACDINAGAGAGEQCFLAAAKAGHDRIGTLYCSCIRWFCAAPIVALLCF